MFSKIYILHILFLYSFFLCSYSSLKEHLKKKKRRDGETGKHKLNEMGALNMNRKSEIN